VSDSGKGSRDEESLIALSQSKAAQKFFGGLTRRVFIPLSPFPESLTPAPSPVTWRGVVGEGFCCGKLCDVFGRSTMMARSLRVR